MPKSSNLPVNPTSMTGTLYLYMIMSLLALNYLLEQYPRHFQYKKARQQAATSVKKGPELSIEGAPPPSHLTDSKTKWPYPRHAPSRGNAQGDPTETVRASGSGIPAHASKTKIPLGPPHKTGRRKRVSWGDLEVFEYDGQDVVESVIEYENDSTDGLVDGESD
ncbi:hypothetical protein K458DRAFT_395255 [Lentithecium fluviatile CBS 122367]|uniref:Uncharacterized protein n=1 Tax=Lentithecium fluviatile CBS 122367 TaxID=1168545 RepID=A0A6G1IJM5_9PLEO|nr:hypothetical protein K458DRAFT_395255 [Lentithecium fluviatile CBS 122367]